MRTIITECLDPKNKEDKTTDEWYFKDSKTTFKCGHYPHISKHSFTPEQLLRYCFHHNHKIISDSEE